MRLEKIDWSVEENNEDEKLLIADLVVLKEKLTEAAEELDFTIRRSSDLELNNIELAYKTICSQCQDIIEFIKSKKFSSIYPYLSEYTGAGPGVGVSNIETQIRFVEMCWIQNSDRRIRLHRAPGDSAQNESERTNACIGDAIVDDGTLQWRRFLHFKD